MHRPPSHAYAAHYIVVNTSIHKDDDEIWVKRKKNPTRDLIEPRRFRTCIPRYILCYTYIKGTRECSAVRCMTRPGYIIPIFYFVVNRIVLYIIMFYRSREEKKRFTSYIYILREKKKKGWYPPK